MVVIHAAGVSVGGSGGASIIIEWPNFLGNRSMVEALLSRLRYHCHTVRINDPSLRDPQG